MDNAIQNTFQATSDTRGKRDGDPIEIEKRRTIVENEKEKESHRNKKMKKNIFLQKIVYFCSVNMKIK
jgi:hypothetical protein